jgi:hypothetical protein
VRVGPAVAAGARVVVGGELIAAHARPVARADAQHRVARTDADGRRTAGVAADVHAGAWGAGAHGALDGPPAVAVEALVGAAARERRVIEQAAVGPKRPRRNHHHHRGLVVVVAALGDDVLGVDLRAQPVRSGRHVGDVDVLAIEAAPVKVVPACVDALVAAVVAARRRDVGAHAHVAGRVEQAERLLVPAPHLCARQVEESIVGVAAQVPVHVAGAELEHPRRTARGIGCAEIQVGLADVGGHQVEAQQAAAAHDRAALGHLARGGAEGALLNLRVLDDGDEVGQRARVAHRDCVARGGHVDRRGVGVDHDWHVDEEDNVRELGPRQVGGVGPRDVGGAARVDGRATPGAAGRTAHQERPAHSRGHRGS